MCPLRGHPSFNQPLGRPTIGSIDLTATGKYWFMSCKIIRVYIHVCMCLLSEVKGTKGKVEVQNGLDFESMNTVSVSDRRRRWSF